MSAYTGIEMAGQGDYLYRRKGSPYWRLKFQYPNEHMRADVSFALGREVKAVEDVSLRTASKREAEILAGPMIFEHRKAMLVHQALRDTTKCWGRLVQRFEMEPGTMVSNPDGSQTIATVHEIIDIRNSVPISRPNLKGFDVELEENVLGPEVSRTIIDGDTEIKKARYKDVDAEIVENYITRNRKSDEDAKLVRDMYAVFKEVSGKTFASAGRQDAEAFVTHQLTKGGKNGTGVSHGRVTRQVALLRAAINVELEKSDKPRLQRNIFDHVDIPDDDEPQTREAYTEADMASVRLRLHEFQPDERLLWVWHASTGIRPSEIYSIAFEDLEVATDPNDIDHETGESRVHRTRYVSIDKGKTAYSLRALPIPQAVLDLKLEDGTTMLPYPISGPMFKRSVRRLCDAINHKLQNWGINTPENGKVFYSCRHRVPRRLMECGVQDEQMSRAIMGHTRRIEPHDRYGRRRGYGHRYTMWSLKPILDKIGY